MKYLKAFEKFNKLSNDFFIEGVGDKYAEKKFGIESEIDRFNRDYDAERREEMVYRDGNQGIIKNPKLPKNIGSSVRGIIDSEGNLYTEKEANTIHSSMIADLVEVGLLKPFKYDWRTVLPTDFITVVRAGNSNNFVIGESNAMMIPTDIREETYSVDYWNKIPKYEEALPVFQKFLNKAKLKNPKFNFLTDYVHYYWGEFATNLSS
jgi:hypothetical protein